MVPIHGEYAVDVMPLTQVVIDSAAATTQPWRIPLLPELPAPLGLFGVTDPEGVTWRPVPGPSPTASRFASMSWRPVTTA
ncbi:hypothetical protein [Streptomyces mirabilis]|uniref:hypothetical protein n=1 Tax=Streptomyces mirabilis TaxID=68239 RepID=UPI0036F3DC28